jgi:hypothetical protein
MNRLLGSVVMAALLTGLASPVWGADDTEAQAVLDKAIKALGGAEKPGAAKAFTWKAKGKVSFGGADNEFSSATTVEGLDHFRSESEAEFMGKKTKFVDVLSGDKGWRKLDDKVKELDKDGVANEKRHVYLQVIPVTLVPLKGKGFKVEAAGTEKVGDKSAAVLKVTGPDGKDFKLYFDKDSGLPVKQVAEVVGDMREEFHQETTFGGYKDFGGIKRATRVKISYGLRIIDQEITDFKPLEKVDPKTFTEPR